LTAIRGKSTVFNILLDPEQTGEKNCIQLNHLKYLIFIYITVVRRHLEGWTDHINSLSMSPANKGAAPVSARSGGAGQTDEAALHHLEREDMHR
jgi:hypothetical protein